MGHQFTRFAGLLIGLLGLLAFPACARASAVDARVDAFARAHMAEHGIPGLAVAVVQDGRITYAKGYGFANLELGVAATPQTVFQSGSVGKQFTAALVMKLVEDGKVSLDAPISTYFPEAPAAWTGITVRHLLTHTAGISDAAYEKAIDLRRDYTEDDLVREIAKLPLDFQPGASWRYSNPGYVLLGVLASRVGGRFYGDQLTDRVFGPLGMTSARIISEADIVRNRAAGYRLVDGELKNQEWVSPVLNTTGDGALYLTVLDLAKWDAALYGDRILTRASRELMWTPARLNSGEAANYGFAWFLGERNGARFVRHGGVWQGFTSDIVRYPDRRLTVIVMTNLARGAPEKLSDQIVGAYAPDLAPPAPTGRHQGRKP